MVEQEDRISLLPDCLLLEIISRLELSTKYVIKTTTTISKRWQHLWTRLPTLVFIGQDDIVQQRRKKYHSTDYYSFIDKTLTQCPTNVNLKKFKFQIEDDSYPSDTARNSSKVNSWIRYAITRNVQEVEIRISETFSRDDFSYGDELFFNNSCIMSMKISHDWGSNCVFNPPNGAISWDKLKCLCIDHGKLDEDTIAISRSPCLETLELNNCYLAACFLKSLFGKFRVERLSCNFETYESFSYYLFDDNDLETCEGFSYDLFNDDDLDDDDLNDDDLDDDDLNDNGLDDDDLNDDDLGDDDDDDEFMSVEFFMSIKFSRCEFNPFNGAIRSLCIERSTLDEHAIGKILFSNPCLETLELNGCCGVRRIDITSKSVKNLVLHGYGDRVRESYIDTLEINAPYILSLKITGKIYLEKFLLENVSSLVKADFNYLGSHVFADKLRLHRDSHVFADKLRLHRDSIEEDLLRGLLSSLGHVNDITLGDYNCLDAATRLREKGIQFYRVGADGDEDRIPELIASGWKKAAADWWNRNKNRMQLEQIRQEKIEEKRESKTEEKVEKTEEYDDEIGFSLFD